MKTRVLLVDDSSIFARTITRFLVEQDAGLDVAHVCSGAEALRSSASWRPEIILLDLGLADGNGLELITELRHRAPSAHIVTLTLLDDASYRKAALTAGADAFVSKIHTTTDLVPALQGGTLDNGAGS